MINLINFQSTSVAARSRAAKHLLKIVRCYAKHTIEQKGIGKIFL